MACASRRAMVRPRPVPPWWRARPSSPCSKASNTRSRRASGTPGPVSATATVTASRPSSTRCAVPSSDTWPCGVNLIALPSRLVTIWRRALSSASTCGRSPTQSYISTRSRWRASGITARKVSASRAAGSNRRSRRSVWPDSRREKSSTSLITCSSARPDWPAASRWRRCSGLVAARSASSVRPNTPFSGVRISWLICARRRDLAALARSASRRRCSTSASAASSPAVRSRTSVSSSRRWPSSLCSVVVRWCTSATEPQRYSGAPASSAHTRPRPRTQRHWPAASRKRTS